jgi:hypothetical protein
VNNIFFFFGNRWHSIPEEVAGKTLFIRLEDGRLLRVTEWLSEPRYPYGLRLSSQKSLNIQTPVQATLVSETDVRTAIGHATDAVAALRGTFVCLPFHPAVVAAKSVFEKKSGVTIAIAAALRALDQANPNT